MKKISHYQKNPPPTSTAGSNIFSTVNNEMPNIKYLNLKGAKVNRDGLVMLLRRCKDLVMLDARDCSDFDENDDEISKLASHISKFMCEGSEFPEFLCGMDNFVLPVDGYSFHLHVEETWDEMLNDLRDAFNDLGDEE
ncbi:unnamed protein product [Prunus armeniaca]